VGRAPAAARRSKARQLLGVIRPGVGPRLTTDVRPPSTSTPAARNQPQGAPAAVTSEDEYRIVIDELASAIPLAADQLDEVERIAPGIRPLRLSLAMLWETVCRAFSGLRTDLNDRPDAPKATGVGPLEVVELA
jgi:hypothetical protein